MCIMKLFLIRVPTLGSLLVSFVLGIGEKLCSRWQRSRDNVEVVTSLIRHIFKEKTLFLITREKSAASVKAVCMPMASSTGRSDAVVDAVNFGMRV